MCSSCFFSPDWLSLELMSFLFGLISLSAVIVHSFFLFFFFLFLQRWNNKPKSASSRKALPSSNYPSRPLRLSISDWCWSWGANPEPGGWFRGGYLSLADQCPHGHEVDVCAKGSLFTDQLVTDALDSWRELFFFSSHPPPPHLSLSFCTKTLPGEIQQWVGPLILWAPRGARTDAGAHGPSAADSCRCLWQWYSNLIWVIAVGGKGSRSFPTLWPWVGVWSDQRELGKIWPSEEKEKLDISPSSHHKVPLCKAPLTPAHAAVNSTTVCRHCANSQVCWCEQQAVSDLILFSVTQTFKYITTGRIGQMSDLSVTFQSYFKLKIKAAMDFDNYLCHGGHVSHLSVSRITEKRLDQF